MVEYKVITKGTPYLEDELNRLAREGWRVVASHHEERKAWPTIILERQKTGVFRD